MKLVNDRLTPHFRLTEFANHLDGGRVLLSEEFLYDFMPCLEDLRVWYGRPININSGYRTVAFNRKVGGASNSLHLKQMAIDFNVPASEFNRYSKARQEEFLNNIRVKWCELVKQKGYYGHVLYYSNPTRLHIGMHPEYAYFDDRR